MFKELDFKPLFGCGNPHIQTVLSEILCWSKDPPSNTEYVDLEDGDQLSLEISTPIEYRNPELPTVVFIHGLGGSHLSPVLVRLSHKIYKAGLRSIRINLRGCGSGKGLAKNIYHAGSDPDILAAILYLRDRYPKTPLILVGVSLGGNILLNLLAKLGPQAFDYIRDAIVIAPPIDLKKCSALLGQSKNRIYEKYFIQHLKLKIAERWKDFPELQRIEWPVKLTMAKFDDLYTVKEAGFKNISHYYEECSSIHRLEQIALPCKVLFSQDDPFVDHTMWKDAVIPKGMQIFYTKQGGHLGFLGKAGDKRDYRWMDKIILEWIENTLSGN